MDGWILVIPAIIAFAFSKCQIYGEDLVNFCGLLRKHALYQWACNSYFYNHLAWRKSHQLFEPKYAKVDKEVGYWSRYCKAHSMVKNLTDFCKVWIGIRWDPAASLFRYESKNTSTLEWSNFKYPEENFLGKNHSLGDRDQCNYHTFDKKGNLVKR